MKRPLITALVATAAAILLTAPNASANNYTFSNGAQINIPDSGKASPYPSTIHVDGVRGPVTDVTVSLNGISHGRPQDLDVLLVPPDRHGAVLMSDACGTAAVSNWTWLFGSSGGFPFMGDTCPGVLYSATNLDGGSADNWNVSPGNTVYSPTEWHRKAMNGDWQLYVVDDKSGYSGKIARGWTLGFTTGSVDTFVPGDGTAGPGAPYPSTLHVTGADNRVITDLNVELPGLAHDRPRDLRILLQGPGGQKVMLMANACGLSPLEQSMYFDDQAPGPLPVHTPLGVCPTTATPTDYGPRNDPPPPAPPGPYEKSLAAFNGLPLNGDWKLYAVDAAAGADGYIAGKFQLHAETRPAAAVEFAQPTVTVAEDGTEGVVITRSGPAPLSAGAVSITTEPGTATSGADYTPFTTSARFNPGETETVIPLGALADDKIDPGETYTVKLTDPTGDAQLGAQSQVEVRIFDTTPQPDTGQQPDTGHPDTGQPDTGHPRPTPPPLCAGKPATIVGTAGKDILRGTPRPDVIAGLGGNDRITAVNGNDTVCGGAGSDTIAGGAGRDHLLGGPGNDRLTGGAGRDTCLGGRGRNRVTCERKTGA
jgi:Ca2+-binding RTX toxin-like protein